MATRNPLPRGRGPFRDFNPYCYSYPRAAVFPLSPAAAPGDTAAMPEVDTDRLIWIVTGVQLNAELGDRPLAYRIEKEVRKLLRGVVGPKPKGMPPRLSPVVVSDVYYLNDDAAPRRPAISVGGPGVNALSALLVNELPTVA